MTWQTIDINTKDAKAFVKAVSKQSRFLIDENINPELALELRNVGYDAIDVFGLILNGRSNEDVFAAAWREQRILMTQDRDFLDDCRFPPYRNAGIVVLPAVNDDTLTKALVYALSVIRTGPGSWAAAKVLVSQDGTFTVKTRNHDTGVRETAHYKLRKDGPPLVWTAISKSAKSRFAVSANLA